MQYRSEKGVVWVRRYLRKTKALQFFA